MFHSLASYITPLYPLHAIDQNWAVLFLIVPGVREKQSEWASESKNLIKRKLYKTFHSFFFFCIS